MKKLLLFPHVFVVMNWAAVSGLVHYVRGNRNVWVRPAPAARPEMAIAAGPRG